MKNKHMTFFDRVSEKVETQISNPNFDREFWKKFDHEFGSQEPQRAHQKAHQKKERWYSALQTLFIGESVLYPLSALAGLLIVFGIFTRMPVETGRGNELLAALEWSEGTAIAQDLELFEDVESDDLILTASDEDWEVLLNENET